MRIGWTMVIVAAMTVPVFGQAVKTRLPEEAPPPALTFRGVIAGRTTVPEMRQRLGPPDVEGHFYAPKFLYRSKTRSEFFDSLTVAGGKEDGVVTSVEAVTIDPALDTEQNVRARLGEPEYTLKLITQTLADYSTKGARFIYDRAGKTIGIVYIPHLNPRVHSGARRLVDLSGHPTSAPRQRDGKPDFSSWKAGAAVETITPLEKAWLPRDTWELHDDLFVRVLYLTDGKTELCLAGADLFGMSYGVVKDFVKAVEEQGCGQLVMGMSHNHAAPDTIGVYGHFPAEYVAYIGQQVVAACAAAKKNARSVGGVHAAAKEMPLIGGRVCGWFRNARNPGVVDPQIAVIRIEATDQKTIATIANFACHVEGLEDGWMDMSADFPGYMCDKMSENLGGITVFLNGAVGGMVSGDTDFRKHEYARRFGLELAEELTALARSAPLTGSDVLKHVRRRVEIPTTNPRLLRFVARMEKARKEKFLRRGRTLTQMHYVQIGTGQFCTIPGELLPEISFEILETMKGYPRMMIGLANDQIGYIVPAEDFRATQDAVQMSGWAYEETMSLGPAAGPVVKEYGRNIVLDSQVGF